MKDIDIPKVDTEKDNKQKDNIQVDSTGNSQEAHKEEEEIEEEELPQSPKSADKENNEDILVSTELKTMEQQLPPHIIKRPQLHTVCDTRNMYTFLIFFNCLHFNQESQECYCCGWNTIKEENCRSLVCHGQKASS